MSVKVHTFAMLSAALLLGTSMASTSAFAAVTSNDVSKTTAQSSMMDKRLMVSNDGFNAERELANARIAIFQGTPETAKTLVKDAQADLKTVAQQAPKDFPNGAPTADGRGTGNADVIPINGEMTIADNMVLTPDKASKVKEANEHLKNGDTTKAMDTLKQGEIDVAFTRVLMPIKETDVHVDAAANLLDQGKYYEANLALKAAQDLLQTDTVTFDDPAAQTAKTAAMPAAGASTSTASASTSVPQKSK